MIKSKIVGRVFQLDKHLGSEFRYESLRLECEADTYEEALKEVESDFVKYIAEKKKELKAKKTSIPTPLKTMTIQNPINDLPFN